MKFRFCSLVAPLIEHGSGAYPLGRAMRVGRYRNPNNESMVRINFRDPSFSLVIVNLKKVEAGT